MASRLPPDEFNQKTIQADGGPNANLAEAIPEFHTRMAQACGMAMQSKVTVGVKALILVTDRIVDAMEMYVHDLHDRPDHPAHHLGMALAVVRERHGSNWWIGSAIGKQREA